MKTPYRFRNRAAAGRELAARLSRYCAIDRLGIVALAGGGVPVAYEIAQALDAELRAIAVTPLTISNHLVGAVAAGGFLAHCPGTREKLVVTEENRRELAGQVMPEVTRRQLLYDAQAPGLLANGATILLVDDIIITGTSMIAAIKAMRYRSPERLVVVAPVSSTVAIAAIDPLVDDVICLFRCRRPPNPGDCFEDFSDVGDLQVRALLHGANARLSSSRSESGGTPASVNTRRGWEA